MTRRHNFVTCPNCVEVDGAIVPCGDWDTTPCGCENSTCLASTHAVHGDEVSRCNQAGTVGVQWVGKLCENCAGYMSDEYLDPEWVKARDTAIEEDERHEYMEASGAAWQKAYHAIQQYLVVLGVDEDAATGYAETTMDTIDNEDYASYTEVTG